MKELFNNLFFKYSFILLFFPLTDIKSQSSFQTWPTFDVNGKVSDHLEIKFEYRNKYDNGENESKSSRIDMGFNYKLKKLTVGIFYREIYEVKGEKRVSEFRPHLDFTYKLNDNMKIRLRNEYRIKEISNNAFRYRLRYSYSFNLWDNYNPFAQNEIFISENKLVRNRISLGFSVKIKKTPFRIKPSYLFEFNRKINENIIDWSQKNILLLAFSIKI